jgi:hypothetical protein
LNKQQRLTNAEIIAEELFNESQHSDAPDRTGKAMRELVNATRQYNPADAPVKTLIGLGSGLTPSGDDLLVGYLAGLWCTVQDRSERLKFVSNFGKATIRLSSETNDISRTYLYHAAQGQVSSRLANLAEAI